MIPSRVLGSIRLIAQFKTATVNLAAGSTLSALGIFPLALSTPLRGRHRTSRTEPQTVTTPQGLQKDSSTGMVVWGYFHDSFTCHSGLLSGNRARGVIRFSCIPSGGPYVFS
jgi:hypothetical protein